MPSSLSKSAFLRAAAGLLVLALALHAAAAGAGDKDEEMAKKHFFRGITFFDEGRYEDALIDFEASYKFHAHWKVKYNIAVCHYALGHYKEAADSILEFVEKGKGHMSEDEKQQAQELIAKLKKELGILRLVGEFKSFSVSIDGSPQKPAASGAEFFLAPGKHSLEISLGDDMAITLEADLIAGETTEIVLKGSGKKEKTTDKGTAPLSAEVEVKKGKKEEHSLDSPGPAGMTQKKWFVAMGWWHLASGAALLVAGAITGGLVLGKKDPIEDTQDAYMDGYNSLPSEELALLKKKRDNLVNEARDLALATNILLPIGAAAAAAGIGMITVSFLKKEKRGKPAAVLPGPGSLTLTLVF
jgi:hypothetical protein